LATSLCACRHRPVAVDPAQERIPQKLTASSGNTVTIVGAAQRQRPRNHFRDSGIV
jgi:hypothetical protein